MDFSPFDRDCDCIVAASLAPMVACSNQCKLPDHEPVVIGPVAVTWPKMQCGTSTTGSPAKYRG
eukprot:639390-Amphidinium_carterae.1